MTAAAIIIDMWASKNANRLRCSENIKYYCNLNNNIKHILLATYSKYKNQTASTEEPYFSTAKCLFTEETKLDILRQEWKNSKFSNESETCSNLLTDLGRPDQQKCLIFSTIQLLYYCNYIDPKITDLYFFGIHWDFCVKYRPVGWMNANSLNFHNLFNKKINILTNTNCVLKENDEFIFTPKPQWKKVDSDGTYKLIKDVWS